MKHSMLIHIMISKWNGNVVSGCHLSTAIKTRSSCLPFTWLLNHFCTYTNYYLTPLRNKIFTHDVNSIVFMVKVCCLVKLLLDWTFYCKTVVKRHLRTNQVICDLEFRMVECQLRYFANTTLPSPIFNSLYQKLGQFLNNPSIYIDVKTEICIRPTSSAHVTTALCW